MIVEYDNIYFPSHDSRYNPMPLIENPSFQIFHGFQEEHHVFYDPVTEWLEHSYSTISIEVNMFWPFLVLSK